MLMESKLIHHFGGQFINEYQKLCLRILLPEICH